MMFTILFHVTVLIEHPITDKTYCLKEGEVKNFEFVRPADLSELLIIKKKLQKKALILDGGTNLLIYIKDGVIREGTMVDVTRVPELRGIQRKNGTVVIGAAETMTDLMDSELLKDSIPFIPEFIKDFGNLLVRNTSTIGGNIADASPIADSAPPLLVLDARVVAASSEGERTIPLNQFFVKPQETALRPDDVLLRFEVPVPKSGRGRFVKLGLRRGTSCSVASAAVWLAAEEGNVREIRIALGGVAPKPLRIEKTEETFTGARLDIETIDRISEGVKQEIAPITDVRGSAAYRREVTARLVARAVKACAGLEES
jgi:carbon-monoxide dehydrogenase medium subunit